MNSFILGKGENGFIIRSKQNLTTRKMKTVVTLMFSMLCMGVYAQNIGINTNGATPHPSALLDVDGSAITGTKRGVLVPRMTSAERDAIVSPATSLLIFNTDDSCYQFFKGIGWSGCLEEKKTCPVGMVDIGAFSIELNERPQIGWYEAVETCLSYGMRLCDVDEWYSACRAHNLGLVVLGGMDNEYEWVNENGTGNYMRIQGYLSCKNSTEVSYWTTFQYRCCCGCQ